MSNIFDDPEMAEGYANARPAVHPQVIQRVATTLPLTWPLNRILDVGCGAGLSTAPLTGLARYCFGTDPAESMVRAAAVRVPSTLFFVAGAEALPIAGDSIDLMSAAGSLNYADLTKFFPEAHRTLRRHSFLIVYDFSPGRKLRDDDSLSTWLEEFSGRYPWPPFNGNLLTPEVLADADPRFSLIIRNISRSLCR